MHDHDTQQKEDQKPRYLAATTAHAKNKSGSDGKYVTLNTKAREHTTVVHSQAVLATLNDRLHGEGNAPRMRSR